MDRFNDTERAQTSSITWQTFGPGHHRLELHGDIDPDEARRCHRLGTLAIADASSLEIDLAHVGVFGLVAVEALEQLRDLAARAGVRFQVSNRSEQVDRVLTAVRYEFESRESVGVPAEDGLVPFINRPDFAELVSQATLRGRDAVLVTTRDADDPERSRIVFVNRAFTDLTGYAADEVIGETLGVLHGELTDSLVLARLATAIERARPFSGEMVNYRSDGTPFMTSWQTTRIGGQGDGDFYAATQSDVTDARRLTRFETAITYVDSRATSMSALPLDDDQRMQRMLESLVHAQVALMSGGSATAELTRHDGTTVVATTATTQREVDAARQRLSATMTETSGFDDTSHSSLLLPVEIDRDSAYASAGVLLHDVHRDRLLLADPHLHTQLSIHALHRRL